jgi:hypothetical protein
LAPTPSPLGSQDAITTALLAVDQVICRIVRAKLRASLSANDGREQNLDAIDVLGDVRLKLVRRVSEDPDSATSIANLTSYAATTAYHACSDYLRAKYPARTRIRNAVRRTIEKTQGLAAWQATSGPQTGDWICGYAGWRHHALPPLDGAPWIDSLTPPGRVDTDNAAGIAQLCRHVLDASNAPVTLDDLVSWMVRVSGGRDLERRLENTGDEEAGSILDRTAAKEVSSEAQWMAIERMRLLWDAIRQLLPWHRAAYLLNLREGELDAFPYYGVASIEDIRVALELQPDQARRLSTILGIDTHLPTDQQFAACWRHLPVEDQMLAQVLGVERSQVIAYRNKGVERLRRMLADLR